VLARERGEVLSSSFLFWRPRSFARGAPRPQQRVGKREAPLLLLLRLGRARALADRESSRANLVVVSLNPSKVESPFFARGKRHRERAAFGAQRAHVEADAE
jgi:hypothetical protein